MHSIISGRGLYCWCRWGLDDSWLGDRCWVSDYGGWIGDWSRCFDHWWWWWNSSVFSSNLRLICHNGNICRLNKSGSIDQSRLIFLLHCRN